jgi:hypothetical protein
MHKTFHEREISMFDTEFKDITHFGCNSTPECVCATLRYDIRRWIKEHDDRLLTEVQEELRRGKIIRHLAHPGLNSGDYAWNSSKDQDIIIIEQFKSKK